MLREVWVANVQGIGSLPSLRFEKRLGFCRGQTWSTERRPTIKPLT